MLTLEPRKQRPYWAIPFSSYQQVTDFLREIETARILKGQPSDGTVSLGTLARCLHELGRPDLRYRTIHVTGTNGKTTVCRMIAALLQAAGMRVGVYTSPHVTHFRERMQREGPQAVAQTIVTSPEYRERNGRNAVPAQGTSPYEPSINALYRHLLARDADPQGLAQFTRTATEAGFDAVVDQIVASPEYRQRFGEHGVPGTELRYCAPGAPVGTSGR